MPDASKSPASFHQAGSDRPGEELAAHLAARLAGRVAGEVLASPFDRGRYATDASIYQVMPALVVVPRSMADVEAVLEIARAEGVPITGRGAGTSQAGQTVNAGIVLDFSRYMNRVLEVDAEGRRAVVEPGVVLDALNRRLKPEGLWFPVDVSTASRATIGGMAANNSAGARSIRYGLMRHNTLAIDALMADGTRRRFAEAERGAEAGDGLREALLALGAREAGEIEARFPRVLRRVAGYNIDALVPGRNRVRWQDILVGSEGTLALFERIEIALSPLPRDRVLGVCHFPTFRAAMEAVEAIVALDPAAVELVDAKMIALGRRIPMLRATLEEFVVGEPAALLLVEFAGEDGAENRRRLADLAEVMAGLGHRFEGGAGAVVEAIDPAFQARVWAVRRQGLNIMMSMKGDAKPVSFVEDCAVPLGHLADFTERMEAIFARHGTEGTWYAHASVGLLHVRPVLNLKTEDGARKLRAIAEEAFDLVAEYGGSHSGEHGDGIVRSEFHERMFGPRMVRAFEAVKDLFDPAGILNPGRVVRAPRMDDRTLFRFPPGYRHLPVETAFDWSAWPAGLHGAVEMCNNNGACRKLAGGAMCPSWRATRAERDLTRGRANTLRLALSGQLGAGALASDAMAETMRLCLSCKACRAECPMSVDMARMKVEVAAARARARGVAVRERMIAALPRVAPVMARLAPLSNLREHVPGLPWLFERTLGIAAGRPLPRWRRDFWRPAAGAAAPEVLLFGDCFNRWFEPENLRAAERVLGAAGVAFAPAGDGGRPLCCGRTYLAAGMVDEARAEMARTAKVLRAHLEKGGAVVGLEPSCVLTFRDEAPALISDWREEDGRRVMLLTEWLAASGRLPPLAAREGEVLLHGHCHQKAHGVAGATLEVLGRVPGARAAMIESTCCGMAGAFGYQAETHNVSMRIGELDLLPAVRANPDATTLAEGFSCRHQIADGAGRKALHPVAFLAGCLAG